MTRLLGIVTAALLAVTAVMALVVSPPDAVQGDAVRLLYVHVPTAWVAMYLSFGVTSLASALWLWPRTRRRSWDLLAGASAEIGVVFIALTLAVGSIWGRATWGVWWIWDARLTTTASTPVTPSPVADQPHFWFQHNSTVLLHTPSRHLHQLSNIFGTRVAKVHNKVGVLIGEGRAAMTHPL